MKNYMEMQFSATLKNVSFARATAACFLLEQDLTLNVINEIKTIVSEAVTNAVVHGYAEDPGKLVCMSLSLEEGKLTITVRDDGVGIPDVKKAREPLFTTREDEDRAGLGFTIMEIFSDSVEVLSEVGRGTTVICTKMLG
ncbi:MAG TPA: anti-sigma F factor [Acholeplasmataceae bacterium]|nr:anti-sigma F factor [Acholeplasmataceae bacterium]